MRKKSFTYSLALVLLCSTSAKLNAQTSELEKLMVPQFGMLLNEAGSGTKASAMGRAFVAIADDPTAIEWNPAGLVQCRQSSAFLAGRFNFGSLSAKSPENFDNNYSLTGSDRAEFYLNYVGFAIPFKTNQRSVVGGVAVRSLSDIAGNIVWKVTEKASQQTTEYRIETTGGLYAMSPAIGVKVIHGLALGMSINFITGRHKAKSAIADITDQSINDVWEEKENKYSGAAIELGALWHALPNLSFGSKVSLPYTLQVSNIKYSDSEGPPGEYDVDVSLKLPTRFVIGAAVQPTRDFSFSLDYCARPWAKARLKIDESQQDRVFDNVNSFHTGIEYVIKASNCLLPLRFGFYINPTQLYEYNATKPDNQGDRIINNVLTSGMGVLMKGFNFEFAFDYHLSQYNAVIFDNEDLPFQTNQPFEIVHSKYRFTISAMVYL